MPKPRLKIFPRRSRKDAAEDQAAGNGAGPRAAAAKPGSHAAPLPGFPAPPSARPPSLPSRPRPGEVVGEARASESLTGGEREGLTGGEREGPEAEDRARAAAAKWLRRELERVRKEAERKLRSEVERARRETEQRVADDARARAQADVERRLEAERRAQPGAEEIDRLRGELDRARADALEARTEAERARGELERARGEADRARAETDEARAQPVSLSSASQEDLQRLGMSPTQAQRVLRYRDERGIDSLDQLDEIPGFSADDLSDLRRRLAP